MADAALLDQNPVVGSFIACTRWNGLEKISEKDDFKLSRHLDNSELGIVLDKISKAIFLVKFFSYILKI